jgi:hypothetical protein
MGRLAEIGYLQQCTALQSGLMRHKPRRTPSGRGPNMRGWQGILDAGANEVIDQILV